MKNSHYVVIFFSSPASREQRKLGRQGVDGWKEVEQEGGRKKKSQQRSDVKMRRRGKRDEDGEQQGKSGKK